MHGSGRGAPSQPPRSGPASARAFIARERRDPAPSPAASSAACSVASSMHKCIGIFSQENLMQYTPNPFQPPEPRPGETPNPVRDTPPHQPSDPVFPPQRDPDGPQPTPSDPPD